MTVDSRLSLGSVCACVFNLFCCNSGVRVAAEQAVTIDSTSKRDSLDLRWVNGHEKSILCTSNQVSCYVAAS